MSTELKGSNTDLMAVGKQYLAAYKAQAEKSFPDHEIHWLAVVSEKNMFANAAESYVTQHKQATMVSVNSKGASGLSSDCTASALAIRKLKQGLDQSIMNMKADFEKAVQDAIQGDTLPLRNPKEPTENSKKAGHITRGIKDNLEKLVPAVKWSIFVMVMPPGKFYEISYLHTAGSSCLQIEKRVSTDSFDVLAILFGTLAE